MTYFWPCCVTGRHVADESINTGNHSAAAWPLPDAPANQSFRCFRIVQWGPSAYSSGDGHELSCNGIELYGALFEDEDEASGTSLVPDALQCGSSLRRLTSVASAGGFVVSGHRSFPQLNGRFRRENGVEWNGAPLYRQLIRRPGGGEWQQGPGGLYFLRDWCVPCAGGPSCCACLLMVPCWTQGADKK